MSTMKGTMRRAILAGVVGAACMAGAVRADVKSDKPGAILIFPKIRVDTRGVLSGGVPTDTELQITNTSPSVVAARCFLVDTTSHCNNVSASGTCVAGVCSNFALACATDNDCDIACLPELAQNPVGQGGCPVGGKCVAGWNETDFQMTLTKRQPVSWKASDGLSVLPCDPRIPAPGPHACLGGSNTGSGIAAINEDPFFGEIRCVEVDAGSFKPTAGIDPANNGGGDLKGEVTIVRTTAAPARIDAAKYNAIAIQSIAQDANGNPPNDGNDTLCLGGQSDPVNCPNGPEYNGCPNTLIYNHFFDNAPVVTHTPLAGGLQASVFSHLTFVPCAADFRIQDNNLASSTLQFLVFNEFEQRFSASTRITCWKELQLSDIDTRPGDGTPLNANAFSIFNLLPTTILSLLPLLPGNGFASPALSQHIPVQFDAIGLQTANGDSTTISTPAVTSALCSATWLSI